jgi:myo-inositol 2-dehydrogenase / D-chiro-inositol 1-dehydrogenase
VGGLPPRVEHLEHLDFLAACRADAAPAVSLEDGLWSVAVGVAAQRSIAEGRAVTLEEVLA